MKRHLEVFQTAERLRDLLAVNGFDAVHPDPNLDWNVFKLFAREPVNCADDSLHCGLGISEQADTQRYNIVFSRQFEINDDEKFYDHLEVIRLAFLPTPPTYYDSITRRYQPSAFDLWKISL